jgi:hypothetical protein
VSRTVAALLCVCTSTSSPSPSSAQKRSMRSICALVCAMSVASAVGKWLITPAMRRPGNFITSADRVDLLGEKSASPHPSVDIEMHVDRPAAPHARRRQIVRRLAAPHLLFNFELANRLLHFGFERHSETEQGNFETKPANGLRFGIGANADHVRASFHRDGSECRQPVTVSVGLHDHAEF